MKWTVFTGERRGRSLPDLRHSKAVKRVEFGSVFVGRGKKERERHQQCVRQGEVKRGKNKITTQE